MSVTPDGTHIGPGTLSQNGLQFCVQQVNGQVRVHVWQISAPLWSRTTARSLWWLHCFKKCAAELTQVQRSTGPWSSIISCLDVSGEPSSLFFCLMAHRSWCSEDPSHWPSATSASHSRMMRGLLTLLRLVGDTIHFFFKLYCTYKYCYNYLFFLSVK